MSWGKLWEMKQRRDMRITKKHSKFWGNEGNIDTLTYGWIVGQIFFASQRTD